ncbi:hypothetical protein E2C01_051244 [Portunus trituberculatus]|uniref:Peptidase A2 domain-containing protein n=1 Tax=Portunus trituberculatus TaxID=210409 RepID=A0A5B7GI49_PORTR|nr:hypothetical protein [Portunus trituberculatus]
MDVCDQDFVRELISTIATKTLDETVHQCYAFEVVGRTTSAIVSPSKSVCATSLYKREKETSNLPRSPAPLKDKCDSCTCLHPKNQCPVTNTVSRNCGKTITTAALTPQGHRGTSTRRVHSASHAPSTTSLPVVITFIHYKGMSNLTMLPDTGADENITGPRHL